MDNLRIESKDGGVAVLRLDKARGNAIDPALVEDLISAAGQLAADPAVRGVLFASAHPKLFCPGLDLATLAGFDRATLGAFMARFAQMLWGLYGLHKPMVAAVGGHAVAGGCILAMVADHRVLRPGAQIGLNEVKVGVPLPWSVTLLLKATVAPPALSRIALLGRNFEGVEALAVGLGDELGPAEAFEDACLARLAEFLEKDDGALATTKRYLREQTLQAMRAREEEAASDFLDAWFSPGTQARIQGIVSSLGKR